MIKPREILKPIGWTRESNVVGFSKGIYDVLAVWPKGPEEEVLSNVGIYTEDQVIEIIKKLWITGQPPKKNFEDHRDN